MEPELAARRPGPVGGGIDPFLLRRREEEGAGLSWAVPGFVSLEMREWNLHTTSFLSLKQGSRSNTEAVGKMGGLAWHMPIMAQRTYCEVSKDFVSQLLNRAVIKIKL